jgi:hypothetical protein
MDESELLQRLTLFFRQVLNNEIYVPECHNAHWVESSGK